MVDQNRYTPEFELLVRDWALQKIPTKRQAHVRGVVDMVTELAIQFAPEQVPLCRLAGWIHDAAKAMSDDALMALAEQRNVPIESIERISPQLLHAKLGYFLADQAFNLNDPQLQSACELHTTGDAGMSVTDKIVFLADGIERNTRQYPGLEDIRVEVSNGLDAAVFLMTKRNIAYLAQREIAIDPRVINLYNELLARRG